MSRRTKIIITVVLILIIIAVVLWAIWVFLRSGEANGPLTSQEVPAAPLPSAPNLPAQQTRPAPLTATVNPNGSVPPSAVGFTALARSFAERYGSYSNQSDFSNLEELYPFMTAALRERTLGLVERERLQAADAENYTGVTTRATGLQVISQNSTHAEILVSTQRSESGSGQDRTYYQNLRLTLVVVDGQWKVDSTQWE